MKQGRRYVRKFHYVGAAVNSLSNTPTMIAGYNAKGRRQRATAIQTIASAVK